MHLAYEEEVNGKAAAMRKTRGSVIVINRKGPAFMWKRPSLYIPPSDLVFSRLKANKIPISPKCTPHVGVSYM
jgi:hypothetical protein